MVLFDSGARRDAYADPSTTLLYLLARLVKVASRIGPTSRQVNLAQVFVHEASIVELGVAFQSALEVGRYDISRCSPLPGWFPSDRAHRPQEIALSRRCRAWFGRGPARDSGSESHQFAGILQPSLRCGSLHRSGAANRQPVPSSAPCSAASDQTCEISKTRFLSGERKVIAIFADDDLGQKSWRGDAALLPALRQGRDPQNRFRVPTPLVFAPDLASAQEAPRFVVALFANLRTNPAPSLWRLLHFLRIDNFLDNRQVRRPSLSRARIAPCSRFVPRSASSREDASAFPGSFSAASKNRSTSSASSFPLCAHRQAV